jgi:hypothetical protein
MFDPQLSGLIFLVAMHNLVQDNEIYEALSINGVAFSLSLHSSNYFI